MASKDLFSENGSPIEFFSAQTTPNSDETETHHTTCDKSALTRSYSSWSPEKEGVTIAWRDLCVYSTNKSSSGNRHSKRIVNNVSGAVKSGTLVALMGASGAGKTTLMNALANRSPGGVTVEGEIVINGRPIGDYMQHISGFMDQHDMFIGSLTVSEHLWIMACLKFKRNVPISEIRRRINKLVKHLGLSHRMHTRIGISGDEKVLSGGEKKRLSFATELLTNPPLLFCDEPTTGLDSYSAQKIVQMMNMVTNQGKTIICTIHQPSSEVFAVFQQLILLADGRIAFSGASEKAIEFFDKLGYKCPQNYNPADFFIRTIAITPGSEVQSRTANRQICDQFAVSEAAKEMDFVVQYEFHMGVSADQSSYTKEKRRLSPYWWNQLYWVTYRSILEVVRDPSVQKLRMFQKIVIALMAGLSFFGSVNLNQTGVQAVQGALFLFVSENTFSPMYSALSKLPKEYPVFIREYKSGLYPILIYYIGNMIAVLPGLILEPVIFVAICYSLAGLRNTAYAITMTTLTTILTMNVSTACGTFFSAAFNSVPMAMAFLVPFDSVLMITSGVFIQLSTLPAYISWAKYLSWMMYSNEAMSIVQWEGISNITCENTDTKYPCLQTGEQVLEKYSFSVDNLNFDLWCMVLLYCVYHILGYLFLVRRARCN